MIHLAQENALPMRPTPIAMATAALALAALPAVSLAHSVLVSSTPTAGATIDAPPDEIVLVFASELDPDGTTFAATDATGATVGRGELDLDVADRNEVRGPVAISADGTYTVSWTAVALDGHTEAGEFAFTVGRTSDRQSPDTATPARGAPWRAALGLILLLGAGVTAMRCVRGAT